MGVSATKKCAECGVTFMQTDPTQVTCDSCFLQTLTGETMAAQRTSRFAACKECGAEIKVYDKDDELCTNCFTKTIQKPSSIPSAAVKYDLGKPMAGTIGLFGPALLEIAKLMTLNAKPNGKYDRDSWVNVPNGVERYTDAFWRHTLEGLDNHDSECGVQHDVCAAFNILARICLRLKEQNNA